MDIQAVRKDKKTVQTRFNNYLKDLLTAQNNFVQYRVPGVSGSKVITEPWYRADEQIDAGPHLVLNKVPSSLHPNPHIHLSKALRTLLYHLKFS